MLQRIEVSESKKARLTTATGPSITPPPNIDPALVLQSPMARMSPWIVLL
jgi:hypothetical protein